MKAIRRSPAALALFACAAACPAQASIWTVSFDPDAPALTNGWDFGATTPEGTSAATKPGGRKFNPAKGGAPMTVESPVFETAIRAVALSAWGNGINSGNASKVEVWGRADAGGDYALLFSRTGLANTLAENEPRDTFAVPSAVACRQLKIGYTKDLGTWVLAKVTVSDDAVRAEPPTNLRAETVDAATRRVRVSWDLADGLTESEWRTFTTEAAGGIGEVPAESVLWRESFDGVPAAKTTREVSASELVSFGLGGWDCTNVRRLKDTPGALLVGWEKGVSGALATPPLGKVIAKGSTLVLRAAKHDTMSGVLPLSVVSGAVTSQVAEVTVSETPKDHQVSLPALAADDRVLVQSCTDVATRTTLVSDLAICAAGTYRDECVVTNAYSGVTAAPGNAVEMTVPAGGTNLWLEVRTVHDGEASAWSEPFHVTLAGTAPGGGDAGDPPDPSVGTNRHITLRAPETEVVFAVDDLPATAKDWDASASPFRFLLQGSEVTQLGSRNAAGQLSVGVYVCTNVFGANWAVLVPGAPASAADVRDAELRLTVRTDAFAARRLELSGAFAQLHASNRDEKSLSLQYRAIAPDGTAGAWTTLATYSSACTAADESPDLAGTSREVSCAADIRLPRGATLEARVYCRKGYKSGAEAPLGFRDFRVRVCGKGPSLLYVIR